MVDVAMVAELLWREALAPAARWRLASSLGMAESAAGAWVTFLAGLHDLGKLSPDFQVGRCPPGSLQAVSDRLASAGLLFPGHAGERPHGQLTAVHLPPLLTSLFGIARPLATRFGEILAAHHGSFSTPAELLAASRAVADGRSWEMARRAHVEALARVVHLDHSAVPRQLDDPAAMVLAGLVSVADWIGSIDNPHFPFASATAEGPTPFDLGSYRNGSETRARHALTTLHWTGWAAANDHRTFGSLFGFQPRGVQVAVEQLTSELARPGLVILEAPTGEGKTEAALYLADRAQSEAGLRGAYFALPTMATSDQMLTRVRAFLETRYPGGGAVLELLHSHRALSHEMELLRELGRPASIDGDPERGVQASVLAGEWFSRRKRGLLAPFGVGTLDQALLAALQVRHVFVRLFGLATKVVIVDEVHAYDVYMTSLLERLLEWLGGCGALVLLLSATLPAARRERLLGAYERGAGGEVATPPDCSYPRLTWTTGEGAGAEQVACSSTARRRLRLEWASGEAATPEQLAARVVEAIAEGGCAAIVCNTVAAAQDVYRVARRLMPGDSEDGEPEVDLLHAHFLFEERRRREDRCLRRFGKPGSGVQRPRRALLIATQVIEQSLDLDFDVMASQLAPVDLLLQRAGRVHRHHRPGRPGPSGPGLLIACDEGEDGPRPDGGTLSVYNEHVLLRTWLALSGRVAIGVPGDVEDVIEAVYDPEEPPAGIPEPMHERWWRTSEQLEAEWTHEETEASNRWIGPPNRDHRLYELAHGELAEDAPEAHEVHQALTRLGPPSVQAICLEISNGQLQLPEGTPIDPDSVPDFALVRRLLERSIAISRRGLTQALLDQPVPDGWRSSALLCRHRLIQLEGGAAQVGRWVLSLDPELGLEVQ